MVAQMKFQTTKRPRLSKDGHLLVVRVPFTMKSFGGAKHIVVPTDAAPWAPKSPRIDHTLIKAIVRAFRWQDLLESGKYRTVRALAKAEKINESYVCRILRLTLLSPKTITSILDGRQPDGLELETLCQPMPADWPSQQKRFGL
jgi:hypothetical protein